MIAETATIADETAEFNAGFERIRRATGPHKPADLSRVSLTPFQRWALKFVAAHSNGEDWNAGCVALADGRVRIASPSTYHDRVNGQWVNPAPCTLLDYAADVADVYSILGY